MAAKRRHWKEKDGRYWARIAIPKELKPFFDNKTQLTEALGGDLRIANENHPAAVARLKEKIRAAQRVLEPANAKIADKPVPAVNETPSRPMTPEDIEQAVWAHYTTGSRPSEITQLRKQDIRKEKKRWIIRITPEAGSVKTGEFRDVPLHDQVVELGFIDFVAAASDGPLFHRAMDPQKMLASAQNTAGRVSEWLHELNLVPEGVHRLQVVWNGEDHCVSRVASVERAGETAPNSGAMAFEIELKPLPELRRSLPEVRRH